MFHFRISAGDVMPADDSLIARASAIEQTYRLCDGLYLLGVMERGVTLYNQQVRAHNLIWALWELHRHGKRDLGKVAVVGGGAAGLTATAALLSRLSASVSVTLFERLWDLCPLQQGSDTRWLHPRIYSWPDRGSRAPAASLPILNWSEGRASDIARILTRGFGEYCEQFAPKPESLAILVGIRNFHLRARALTIDWVGTRTERAGAFFRLGKSEGEESVFQTIILTAGFGLEQRVPAYETAPYWRNEQIAQPHLEGEKRNYVVSGYGDGALVDLCRLTIERFRQDTILYELFGPELEDFEAHMRDRLEGVDPTSNLFPIFRAMDSDLLVRALAALAARLRKDTSVVLHISGKDKKTASLSDIFGPTSSRLNRLLTYLLHRCGAFATSLADLDSCVRTHRATADAVLCRHGANTREHLRAIIADYEHVDARLDEMMRMQAQSAVRLWRPGAFPMTQQRTQR
jgi:hypothetical protein